MRASAQLVAARCIVCSVEGLKCCSSPDSGEAAECAFRAVHTAVRRPAGPAGCAGYRAAPARQAAGHACSRRSSGGEKGGAGPAQLARPPGRGGPRAAGGASARARSTHLAAAHTDWRHRGGWRRRRRWWGCLPACGRLPCRRRWCPCRRAQWCWPQAQRRPCSLRDRTGEEQARRGGGGGVRLVHTGHRGHLHSGEPVAVHVFCLLLTCWDALAHVVVRAGVTRAVGGGGAGGAHSSGARGGVAGGACRALGCLCRQ